MREKRINPETGVHEERDWLGWGPIKNSEGKDERVNPETGVQEERDWLGWGPKKNAEGHDERVDLETGVHEERDWLGWGAKKNSENRDERVNPETGVHEERDWLGWGPKKNSEGRDERVNPETGVHEERDWLGWSPTERRKAETPRAQPRESSGSSEGDGSDWGWIFYLGALALVIWLVIQAVKIAFILSPIWLGTICAGAIAGFCFADGCMKRIPAKWLAKVPVKDSGNGNGKCRLIVESEFLEHAVKFRIDGIRVLGTTIIFAAVLVSWPMVTTPETTTRVLLMVGMGAGILLGTWFGMSVLRWRLENLLLGQFDPKNVRKRIAPGMALIAAIPLLVLFSSNWVISLVEASGDLQMGKALGWQGNPPSPAPANSSYSEPVGAMAQDQNRSFGTSPDGASSTRTQAVQSEEHVANNGVLTNSKDLTSNETLIVGKWLEKKYVIFYPNGSWALQRNEESPLDSKGRHWSISGNSLTLSWQDSSIVERIESLDQSQLSLRDEEGNVSLFKRVSAAPDMQSTSGAITANVLNSPSENGSRSGPNPSVAGGGAELMRAEPMSGERFPETRRQVLVAEDLGKMSDGDLRYAINEMFARHGGTFGKKEVRQVFEQFSWYRPRTGVDFDQIEQRDFSDMEKGNLKLIGATRDARKAGNLSSPRSAPESSPKARELPFHQGKWVMKKVSENPKDTDYLENILQLSDNKFTYTMKFKSVLRKGAPPWTNPSISKLRSFSGTTVYSGTIVAKGQNTLDAKVESVSWPDKSPNFSPAAEREGRSKIGKTWHYIFQNGVLMDARNSDTVFHRQD